MTITLEEALDMRTKLTRMSKPELLVNLKQVLELIEQTKPELIKQPMSMAQAVAQLGDIIWRDKNGKHVCLKQMDVGRLRVLFFTFGKRVKELDERSSCGNPYMGLMPRHWLNVFDYYLHREMPAEKFGFYNRLQEEFLSSQKAATIVGTPNNFDRLFEDVYTRLEDDKSWY